MKQNIACLAAALAALAGAVGTAQANDYGRTAPGIRMGAGGVPVPAPAPVPDMPTLWYISLSTGYAFSSSGSIETIGPDIGGYSSFGDHSGPMNFGFAAGRKFWGNMRGEVDFTFRPKQTISQPITRPYAATTSTYVGQTNVTSGLVTRTANLFDVSTYSVDRSEESRSANQTAMLNLYYDIPTGSAFTPYFGGGIGLVTRQTTRQFKDHGTCTGTTPNVYTDPFTGATMAGAAGGCTGPSPVDGSGSKQTTGYGFAGAAMAGVAYEVSRGVVFDVGYRYIWQDSGAELTLPAAVGPDSTIKFESRSDHEIKATVRWYID